MYFRISNDAKLDLEKQIRSTRLRSSLLHYPACIALFSGLGVLFLMTKGHGIVWAIRHTLGDRFSDTEVITALAGVVVASVAVALVFLLRNIVRERIFEQHAFCATCNVVDKDDERTCPVCKQPVHSQSSFFITHYSDEIQLANRLGLAFTDEA